MMKRLEATPWAPMAVVKPFFRLMAAALLALFPLFASANEIAQIRSVVFDYLDGINTVDRERLERAFHPGAEMKHVDDEGALQAVPIPGVIDRWVSREPGQRTGKVLSVDVYDDRIARVVFDYDGAYLDFLTLAKIKGQWKLIDKVFISR